MPRLLFQPVPSRRRLGRSLRYKPSHTKLPDNIRTPDFPEFEPRRTEILLHQELPQLAQHSMRQGIRQQPRRIIELDFRAVSIKAHTSHFQIFHPAFKIFCHYRRLHGDDGSEVVAFGDEVVVLGEEDVVRGVYLYRDSGRVDAERSVLGSEDGIRDGGQGLGYCF